MSDEQMGDPESLGNIGKSLNGEEKGGGKRFGGFAEQIIDLMPIGVIAFSEDLRVIAVNNPAKRLLCLRAKVDESLAAGTDQPGMAGLNWTRQLQKLIETGQPSRYENVSYNHITGVRLLRIECIPLRAGELAGVVTVEDVTDEVNIQRQLANAEKMATMGMMASKVAHELNNPLDGILRYINLASRLMEQENLAKPKEYLAHCQEGIARMAQIVRELLDFSRSGYASFELVPVEQLIEEAIRMLHWRLESGKIKIVRDFASDTPAIPGGSLFQVFCNLLSNAFDAMPEGGVVTISTRPSGGNMIIVQFRDTGCGFSPDCAQAIFEPFFSTKKGSGTGLGLAICKDIVERYNGRITAENAPEGGSIFTVYLPIPKSQSWV